MTTNSTPSFEDQVNTAISSAKTEDGKLSFPDGTSEGVVFAANAELRRRDTQSAYTKNQQRLKALETENSKLATSWEKDAVSNLSNQEQARLEELKVQDPDRWRTEIAKLEDDKRNAFQAKRTAISQEASQATEIERRTAQLNSYNEANPDHQLTDEVIENDIPPRLTKQLEKGDITFEQFIDKASKFLVKPKKIVEGDQAPDEPNFAGSRGSHSPSADAIAAQNADDYSKEIF